MRGETRVNYVNLSEGMEEQMGYILLPVDFGFKYMLLQQVESERHHRTSSAYPAYESSALP